MNNRVKRFLLACFVKTEIEMGLGALAQNFKRRTAKLFSRVLLELSFVAAM
jgi:hypothetical protein